MEYQGKSGWGHRPGWKVSNLFKNAFENMSDCFGIFSAIRDETGQIFDFEVEFVNEMAAFQCGSKREEQIGRRLLEMYPEYRTNGVFEEYCQLVENRIRYIQKPIFYYDPLNQREATRYELWAVRAGDGIAVLLRYTDEQKKIEAALYESEDAFDKTFLESEIPMTILETPDGLIMEANPAWLQLTGLEWREVADRPLMDLEIWQNAADQDKRPQTFRLGEDLNQELELRTRMAQTIYVLSSFTLINRNSQPCWLMAMVDITERKLNERAFAKKETERQMHDIITFLPDATFAIDTEGKVIAWNLLMEKLTEVKAEEILGKNSYEYSQILYGSRRPILIDLVLNYVQEIEGKYIEIIRENDTLMAEGSVVIQGKTFCLWGKASPLYDTGGKVVGAIETIRDITEIRSTEKKLRESEERYHKLIQSASDAIIFAEADTGVIIEVNQQAEKLFAMSTREITGRHISQLLPPAESDLYKKMLFSVEKGKSVFRMPKDKDLNVINRYGELTPVEISASLIEVGGKKVFEGIFRDITERKRIEQEKLVKEVQIATKDSQDKMSRLKKIASHSFGLDDIGIFSESMKKIYQQALKYHQDRSLPILIQGETGTGKEIIAKLIHYGDLDEVAPYIDLNCAAISHGLFESELFGYEAGSFTGSLNSGKKGKFDLAAGGTLFFDEVTEIPIDLQAKLLRVIQEKEFYRVGGLKKTKTDVRIICATNADLESKISEGGFRKDLYYRLKVGHIIIPPLRERSEEILPLTRGFLKEYSQKRGKKFIGISDNAKRILHQYPWPGNVRELKNTIEWVTFMYDDQELQPHHLDIITTTGRSSEKPVGDVPAPAVNRRMSLDNFTNQLILEVLNRNKGNMKETARELGISRSTLYNRLKTGK